MDSERKAAKLRRELADPLLAVTHPVYRPLLWLLLACILIAIAWAAWAELDEVTRGDGRVVPYSRIQKIQSLEPVEQWWLECLTTGHIAGGDFGGEWPEKVSNARLLEALGRWLKARQIRARVLSDVALGRKLAILAPSYEIKNTAVSKHAQKRLRHHPGLDALRADWNAWLGQEMSWE